MTIETKFNIGQKVYYIYKGCFCTGLIVDKNINCVFKGDKVFITTEEYKLSGGFEYVNRFFDKSELFATKQDLLDSL